MINDIKAVSSISIQMICDNTLLNQMIIPQYSIKLHDYLIHTQHYGSSMYT